MKSNTVIIGAFLKKIIVIIVLKVIDRICMINGKKDVQKYMNAIF